MSSPEVAAPTSRTGSGTLRLLANELATQFRRWRTWAMLAALALIPILLGVAIRLVGGSRPGRGPAFLDQITDNGLYAMVDLADEGRRLAVEADSFEHHGNRRGFRKDVRRYSELVVFGWTVLRFTWEDVMLQPGYVLWALSSWRRRGEGIPVQAPPAHLPRARPGARPRR